MTSNLQAAALAYASHGWPVFPLHSPARRGCSCGELTCGSPGKHPRTARGYLEASPDVDTVTAWWNRWPEANVGLHPAGAGFVVIDVDGAEGESAAAALGLLAEPTLEVITGRQGGGRHRYYRHPGGEISNLTLAPKLDVRADHGYVLVPPSIHPTGRAYRWLGKLDEVGELPGPVAARLRSAPPAPPSANVADAEIREGARNATLTRLAGAMRRHGCSEATIAAALAAENAQRCQPPLTTRELERIAASVGRYRPALATTPAPRLVGSWDWR